MSLSFNKHYFTFAALIFITEVIIALFVRDRFIRPYVGDTLVVILIYCFIRSFFNAPVVPLATGVLLFAFTIEFLQYLNIVEKLSLQKSPVASTVIGTSFAWNDILAYTAGFLIILVTEKFASRKKSE